MDIHYCVGVLWSLILCLLPIPVPLTLLGVNPKVPTPTYMVAEYPGICVRSMHAVQQLCLRSILANQTFVMEKSCDRQRAPDHAQRAGYFVGAAHGCHGMCRRDYNLLGESDGSESHGRSATHVGPLFLAHVGQLVPLPVEPSSSIPLRLRCTQPS